LRIAIIGGSGKMGQWFADFLRREGHEVVISGRNPEKLREAGRQLGVATASNEEAVQGAEVVLLSVPIDSFESVVKELSPHIQPDQVVADVTSVKVMPVAVMKKYLRTRHILGTHPLFGPGAKSLAHQNFVLTSGDAEGATLVAKAKTYLEERGARVSVMTPAEHDKKMTVILGLAHFIALISADTLLSSEGFRADEAIGGITYKVLMTLVESVLTEDPALYAAIQMNLPDLPDAEKRLQEKARAWAHMVVGKDWQGFVRRMNELKDKLRKDNPDFGKAYEAMYRIASEKQGYFTS
jgi:prephenate dehydrogenase